MKFKGLLVAAALVGLMATAAFANSIQMNLNVTPNPDVTSEGNGIYDWSYTVQLTGSSELQKGDYFVIVDFAGFAGFDSAPADWTPSTELTTPVITGSDGTIANVTLVDDPTLLNLKWTYTGGTDGIDTIKGQYDFNTPFVADSIYRYRVNSRLLGTDHIVSNGDDNGLSRAFLSNADVPVVPLPAAAWASFGMLGLLGIARMRKAWR